MLTGGELGICATGSDWSCVVCGDRGFSGEVSNVVLRRVWRGLLDWWNPARVATAGAEEPFSCDAVDRRGAEPAGDASEGWVRRELASQDVAGSTAEGEVSDEELLDFLAADIDPVEANPEFKRKLREQLWAIISQNSLPRQ